MPKLKTYKANQRKKTPDAPKGEPSGVACAEKKCEGEMMIVQPVEEHYTKGRAGEPGAIKSALKRAVCNECNWKGWV